MDDRYEDKKKIDYTYSKNKYVNPNKIKINKSFLIRRALYKILSIILCLFVIVVTILFFIHYSQPLVVIGEDKIHYDSNVPLDIGQTIVYSKDKEWFDLPLYLLKQKEALKGEIVTLPFGISKMDRRKRVLKESEYIVKCISGYCEKDKMYLINKKDIYGVVVKNAE